MKKLALILLLLAGCQEASFKGGIPKFPSFTSVRSDLLDPLEGTVQKPLRISEFPCTIVPPATWQEWLCNKNQNIPATYPTSNHFSYTNSVFHSWIIVANNEWIQNVDSCNNGPPNQSRTFNSDVFFFENAPSYLEFQTKVENDNNCQRIPYMSASYTRGTQAGDPLNKLISWDDLTKLKLYVEIEHFRASDRQAWQQLYVHFKDPKSGLRYMVLKELVTPEPYPNMVLNWNWPIIGSFQYPGAKIGFLPVQPSDSINNGNHTFSWSLTELALVPFPEFKDSKPDLLGVEFGIESAGDQHIKVRLNKVEFR